MSVELVLRPWIGYDEVDPKRVSVSSKEQLMEEARALVGCAKDEAVRFLQPAPCHCWHQRLQRGYHIGCRRTVRIWSSFNRRGALCQESFWNCFEPSSLSLLGCLSRAHMTSLDRFARNGPSQDHVSSYLGSLQNKCFCSSRLGSLTPSVFPLWEI
jgi:hypothetical protein